MDVLEVEVKTQPNGVRTEHNFDLIDYYQTVVIQWRKGGEFKKVLLSSSTSIQSGNSGSVRTISPTPSGDGIIDAGSDSKEFEQMVENIDLNDGGSSLQAVIDYLRTLKNQ